MKQSINEIRSARGNGFTLVELVIVITVIIILTSISAIGLNIYLKDARDSERETKTLLISNALERYYDKNGEYPSCSLMRDNVTAAAEALGGIDEDTFRVPGAESPSGLTCGTDSTFPSADNDTFMYESPFEAPSNPNVARTTYTILYWNEDKEQVMELSSRRGW